jgi:hypothetical protein
VHWRPPTVSRECAGEDRQSVSRDRGSFCWFAYRAAEIGRDDRTNKGRLRENQLRLRSRVARGAQSLSTLCLVSVAEVLGRYSTAPRG